ncbi:hypothetical protein [Streptomyces sp. NPDC019539]|uniref:hypothetical protein n=1 Tax=Streptomyces sp. NPDC019539 TaxID=3365063 RepID=UPI00378CAB78
MLARMGVGRLLVAAGVVLLLGAGGAVHAMWTTSGSGSGTAATGTTTPVTLSPGEPTGGLFPGGRADILLTATNSSSFPVRVGALALETGQGAGGFAADASHAGCGLSALTFARQTNGGTGWTIPARAGAVDGVLPIRLPNALMMSLDAANACQGARIIVYLAVD